MLSRVDNFLETLKKDGKPDRFVKQFEATSMVPGDPVCFYIRGNRFPGMEPLIDRWGTRIVWPAGEIGAIPDPNPAYQVVKDICDWQDYTKVPDLVANCSDPAAWAEYMERAKASTADDTLFMMFAPTGVFERMHFLMGFEDTLVNLMVEPEAAAELAMAIGEYRYQGYKLMVENCHPKVLLLHDDWGSKTQLFMRPEVWREIIKPAYQKAYDYLHEQGVIIMHHSDSFCEPILEDMIDLHIDIWQGALPQNDIAGLLKKADGRITIMGGLDAGIIDRDDSTEEEIRAEVRRACMEYGPCGHFIPCITYGGPGPIHPIDGIINDEIDKCSKEIFG
ncbi:MAG: uroporphyrinogen decarboxylase (URO-D) [Oscillospiraceae bacterium]|nr:uroporphyrinogen decarboxylase (URO-D) [Oscillospiraceae bacterium]